MLSVCRRSHERDFANLWPGRSLRSRRERRGADGGGSRAGNEVPSRNESSVAELSNQGETHGRSPGAALRVETFPDARNVRSAMTRGSVATRRGSKRLRSRRFGRSARVREAAVRGGWGPGSPPRADSRKPAEQPAMPRDRAIGPLARPGEERRPEVEPKPSFAPRHQRERAEHRFGAARDSSIGLDEMHRFAELAASNLRRALRRLLIRRVFDAIPGHALPARDPDRAEVAVTVVEEKRAGGHSRRVAARAPRSRTA